MLVLTRKEGDWLDITHEASGDTIGICVTKVESGHNGKVKLAFDDKPRNFSILREEAKRTTPRNVA